MSRQDIRILGIDTSLRSSGFGVVSVQGGRFTAVEYGTVRVPQRLPLSECLLRLQKELQQVIDRTRPEAVAIEGVFFCKNAATVVKLGEARGAAIALCAGNSLPVYEYAPRRVKQSVVGFGGAEKEQVRKMVMTLLALREEPKEDEADALAIALCHLHSRTGVAALMAKPI